MKNLLLLTLLFAMVGLFSQTAVAQQCDRNGLSPIKCGYYEEGYQDGATDAQNNQQNDYKRYKSKYERQYESFYKQGYEAGYTNIRPFSRWSDIQKNTYDQGFDDGRNDRRRNISRLPARYEGQFNQTFQAFYEQGYFDGYDNRQKQYDTPIGNTNNPPTFPFPNPGGSGTATGTVNWTGRVEDRVNITIQGNVVRSEAVAGQLFQNNFNLQGVLPGRNATVSVQKRDGRGTASVIQQPDRSNNFTAIIQVSDPARSADNYDLQITWQSANVRDTYSSGKLTWSGKVDHMVKIRIDGDFVESTDVSGGGLSGVNFNLNGYLAARSGKVKVKKRDGRGRVTIIEQPSPQNNFNAVIQIFDPRAGDDNYRIEVTW